LTRGQGVLAQCSPGATRTGVIDVVQTDDEESEQSEQEIEVATECVELETEEGEGVDSGDPVGPAGDIGFHPWQSGVVAHDLDEHLGEKQGHDRQVVPDQPS
jgi:hypothetical protein